MPRIVKTGRYEDPETLPTDADGEDEFLQSGELTGCVIHCLDYDVSTGGELACLTETCPQSPTATKSRASPSSPYPPNHGETKNRFCESKIIFTIVVKTP